MAETYYAKPDNSPVNDLTLNSYDALIITNGGTANGTIINSDGAATVNDGGSANNTTVNEGGTLHLIGGAATGISVASDGRLEVNKGATATGIEAEKGATLVFDVAASTHIAGTSDGAAFQIQNGIATGFALETGVLTVSSGGTAVNATLNSAGFVTVYSGGKAINAVANASGEIKVFSGGTATGATIKTGGKLTVESSGFCDDATVEAGGNLYVISSGGTAAGTYIGAMGNLAVSKGGTAYGTTVGAGGFLTVGTKGIAEGADVNGFLNVLDGGLASNVTVNEGAVVYIQSKGTGSDVYVDYGGILEAMADGRLKGATVAQGGSATIHADVMASNVVIDGGKVTVMSDGWAYQSGVSSNTIVRNGGRLVVSGGGYVVGAAVSAGGHVTVESDATFSSATVVAADVTALDGACVSRLNLEAGGILNVVSGGKAEHINVSAGGVLTGILREASELKFYGGTLDLNIAGVSPDSEALVDEISFLSIMPVAEDYLCTLTVSDTQAEGAYKLIEGASGFDTSKAITVKDTLGTTLGTLTVNGGSTTIGGVNYTLAVTTEDVLAVTIGDGGGITPDITGDLDSSYNLEAGKYASSVNILDGGKLHVSNGGLAEVTAINAGGSMVVSQGGSASDTTVNNGGKLYVSKGGIASKTELNDGGKLFASGSVGGATVSLGGSMFVSSGATVNDINVSAGGFLWIYDGVTATGIVAAKGAELYFNVAPDTYVKGTYAESDFEMKDATLSDFTAWKKCTVAVRSGGVTSNTTLNDGTLQVDGGVAKDTVVKINGEIWLYGKGSVVSGVTFQDGCHLWIRKSGGKLTGKVTFETGAGVTYSDGASATLDFDLTQTTVGADALVNDLSPVLAAPLDYTLTVDGTEAADDYKLAEGATGFDKTITVKDTLGTTLGTLTVNGGSTTIGGRDYTLTLSTGGSLGVTVAAGGGITPDITGDLSTPFELTAGMVGSSVNILDGGRLNVSNGGFASQTTVNSGGDLYVSAGGSADVVTVNFGGDLWVSNGATATLVKENGGYVYIDGGATVEFVPNSFDGVTLGGAWNWATVHSGTTATNIVAAVAYTAVEVYDGGSANNTTVSSGGKLNVLNGGKANGATIAEFGKLHVSSGGSAIGIVAEAGAGLGFAIAPGTYAQGTYAGSSFEITDTVADYTVNTLCNLDVYDGGTANNTTVSSGGIVNVFNGGKADNITVSTGGYLAVSSGGTATNIVWTPCEGYVYVYDGAYATFVSTYTGVYFGSDGELLESAAAMDGKKVAAYYEMYVMDSGLVTNTEVDYGDVYVWSGGVASDTKLVNGGYLLVSSGGVADNTTITDGALFVSSGGVANKTTVNDKGIVEGSSGGLIDGVVVNSGGSLLIYNGAKLTGQMTFVAGAEVIPFVGSILDFDLTQTAPDAAALVNDLSILMGTPGYTLTVDGTQARGTYNLAGNATGFSKAISVRNTSGVDYGYLTFGGTLSTSFANFTLNLTADNTLTVNVAAKGGSDTTPPTITITPSTTELAKSVVMTADFTDNVAVATQQYRIGDGAWLNYEAPFTVTENVLVSFRATDTSGNTTVESYEVQNIQPDEQNVPDNGWNDYLYDKKKGWNKDENISQFASNTITGNGEIHLDLPGTIALEGMHNMFGNDGINVDSGDVGKISVPIAAKMSFSVKSTADGTFYIYQDGFDKKGNRAQLTVGKVSVKKGKVATLSGICLATDGEYYASMTAKNVKKPGPSGIYNVTVVDSTIFVDADNGWNNAALNKTVVDNPFKVERGVKTVKLDNTDMIDGGDFNNFVGFSDPVDYAKLDLASTTYLSFDLGTNGSTKFTLWKRETGTGNFSKVGGVTSLKSKKGELVTKSTKAQLLEVSDKYDYFVSMECTDATKGGSAYYNVNINTVSTRFFDSNDLGENNWLFDKKNKVYNDDANLRENTLSSFEDKDLYLDNTVSGDPAFNNFVGFKDSTDYAKVVLTKGGSLRFKITALADVTFEIWQKGEDKKGNPVLNSLQKKTVVKVKDYAVGNTETTDALTLEAGDYYISVTAKSTKSNEKGSAFYNVTALFASSEGDALVMPETDSLGISDALSFGNYGADALADASAVSSLAELDGKSAWQSLLA